MDETLFDSLLSGDIGYSVFSNASVTPSTDLVRWPAAWRDSKIGAIQQLAELPPDWDSYGAYPIDPLSIYFAVGRVRSIATETLEEPRVSCSPTGHVVLAWEWDQDSKACEIDFLPDGRMECTYSDDRDPSRDVDRTAELLGEILPLIPGTRL